MFTNQISNQLIERQKWINYCHFNELTTDRSFSQNPKLVF